MQNILLYGENNSEIEEMKQNKHFLMNIFDKRNYTMNKILNFIAEKGIKDQENDKEGEKRKELSKTAGCNFIQKNRRETSIFFKLYYILYFPNYKGKSMTNFKPNNTKIFTFDKFTYFKEKSSIFKKTETKSTKKIKENIEPF